jgi:hypothetical protein
MTIANAPKVALCAKCTERVCHPYKRLPLLCASTGRNQAYQCAVSGCDIEAKLC